MNTSLIAKIYQPGNCLYKMELIEIIKSSILLFSMLILLIIIASFGLFKIRNQAKRKKIGSIKKPKVEYLIKKTFNSNSIQKQQLTSDKKTSCPKPNHEKNLLKYKVVNNKMGNLSHKSNTDYQPNVYKFYEEFNTDQMFKIKPETKSDC